MRPTPADRPPRSRPSGQPIPQSPGPPQLVGEEAILAGEPGEDVEAAVAAPVVPPPPLAEPGHGQVVPGHLGVDPPDGPARPGGASGRARAPRRRRPWGRTRRRPRTPRPGSPSRPRRRSPRRSACPTPGRPGGCRPSARGTSRGVGRRRPPRRAGPPARAGPGRASRRRPRNRRRGTWTKRTPATIALSRSKPGVPGPAPPRTAGSCRARPPRRPSTGPARRSRRSSPSRRRRRRRPRPIERPEAPAEPLPLVPADRDDAQVAQGRSSRRGPPDDPRRHPHGRRARPGCREDHGIRPDLAVVAHRHRPEDAGPAADVDPVADDRDLEVAVDAGDPQGRVLADLDVVADRPGVEDDPAVVPDPDPPPQPDRVRQRDPARPTRPTGTAAGRGSSAGPGASLGRSPSASCRTGGRRRPRTPARRRVPPWLRRSSRRSAEEADPRRVEVPVAPVQRRGASAFGAAIGRSAAWVIACSP